MTAVIAAMLVLARGDIVLADFEGVGYGAWKTTGTAFGVGPAQGTLPNQMEVSGYEGRGLVNSYNGGDGSTGTLTSPEFVIRRDYIRFLIGGGQNLRDTCMNLVVDGKTARQATGPNAVPGGSEALRPDGWDVHDLQGKKAVIEIVDRATGGWGHINIDQIVMTDERPPMTVLNASRLIRLDHRYLMFPMKRGAARRHVTLTIDRALKTSNEVEIADGKPDWWAAIDVSQYLGRSVAVKFDQLLGGSKGMETIRTSNVIPGLYKETYRPQYHFSAKSGWLNDPNGLVYFGGEWHMFFQHDPMGGGTAYKLWGHAVSKDLVHWTELPDALYPDDLGSMWSGSAVVDTNDTSGFGEPGHPPLVMMYTAAGDPSSQCIAYSTDGRNFTKYSGNPVIKQISPYNRDPKVMWYAPTKRWIVVLYVEHDGKHTVEFHSSKDLKHWEYMSRVDGFYECPDFFELPVEGTSAKKWVLSAANTDFMVGSFDGHTFTPETPKIRGIFGSGYYAPQTFSNAPGGRRIQVGWMQTSPPDMPFTQSMSLPMELTLVRDGDGYRLVRTPVKELEALENQTPVSSADQLSHLHAKSAHLHLVLSTTAQLTVRGTPITLNADSRDLDVGGHKHTVRRMPATLDIYVDVVGLEVFVEGDYIPLPVVPRPDDDSYSLLSEVGGVGVTGYVATMKSIWN